MTYEHFATYEEIATQFRLTLCEVSFVQERQIAVKPDLFAFIQENVLLRRNYATEHAICESIIAPMLMIVSKEQDLPVWSHFRFDIAPEEGLMGVPNFLVAPASAVGTTFQQPVICVAEAKREDFNAGWAQALAEMIAAQRYNQDETMQMYGIVTTGRFWQFGMLERDVVTLENVSFSAQENLQRVMNILNWVFFVAKQQVIDDSFCVEKCTNS